MNIHSFAKKKANGERFSVVTCYDYSSALIVADSNIDCILVGDSLAMTVYGHSSTLKADIPMMAAHVGAVARGLEKAKSDVFIIADMPFQTYRKDLVDSVSNAAALMQAGAHAVKIEGARGNLETVRHFVDGGIPVNGHIGLTPQFINQLGGFRVQGKTREKYQEILDDAKRLEDAGCFSLTLEGIPAALGAEITKSVAIPTIGIGAGVDCDAQVLVWQDLLGINKEFKPKFVRTFADNYTSAKDALNQYHSAVLDGSFPNLEESY